MLTKDEIIEGLDQLSQKDRDAVLDVLIRRIDEGDATLDFSQHSEGDPQWSAELDRRIDSFIRGDSTAACWPEAEVRLERLLEEMGEPTPGQQ